MTKIQFKVSKSRSYSRKGCKECKRRKIKCDEGKPECWQCSRLNKPCKYPTLPSPTTTAPSIQFDPNALQSAPDVSGRNEERQVITQSNKVSKNIPNTPNIPAISPPNHMTNPPNHITNPPNHITNPPNHITNPPNHITNPPNNITNPPNHITNPPNHITNPPSHITDVANLVNARSTSSQTTSSGSNGSTPTMSAATDDTSAIIHEPVGIVNGHLQGSNNPLQVSTSKISSTPSNKPLLYSDFPAIDFDYSDLSILATDINSLVDNLMGESKHDPVDFPVFPLDHTDADSKSSPFFQIPSIKEGHSVFPTKNIIQLDNLHERIYLEEFQRIMVNPYDLKLDSSGTTTNPFQEILLSAASREPYVVPAMLAHGAFCLLGYSGLPQDEQAFHHYLLKCLKHLAPTLTKVKDMDKQVQISVVESSMLTVLLLSTVHASFPNLDWRSHLRKAGEILIKLPQGKSTPALIMCKYWYMLIEVVAELSLNYGGTLKEDHELDSLICEGYPEEIASMKKYYIIEELGFNMMFGFHNDGIALLRDLCKISRKARSGNPYASEECLRISTELFKFRKWSFLSTSGYITVEEAQKYMSSGRPHLYITPLHENGNTLWISWLDISHQSYIIASQVTLLTRGFGLAGDSTIVQGLVDEFTKLNKYMVSSTLTTLFYPLLMCQWPLYSMGMHCIKEKDRYSVMRYFRQLARFGIHSAKYLLKRLLRVWYPETQRSEDDDDNDTFAY